MATSGTILKRFDVSRSRLVLQRADWKIEACRLAQPDFEELPLLGGKDKTWAHKIILEITFYNARI